MISVIIPTYRNPEMLGLCLKSIIENQVNKNEIIVSVDGYIEESQYVLDKWKEHISVLDLSQNQGMQTALNLAVYQASNEKILIVNDDNVFCNHWDVIIESEFMGEGYCLTIQQIEPIGPSIFNFPINNLGRTAKDFQYDNWIEFEKTIRKPYYQTDDGGIFPFLITKKDYMIVGGFDTGYPSPFICDWDFFLKLDLNGIKFHRTHACAFYHFGSSATKNGKEATMFKATESPAAQVYFYKWGFPPQLFENNSHKPKGQTIKGIKYE